MFIFSPVFAAPPIDSLLASFANLSISGSFSILEFTVILDFELLGEAKGDFPGVNFLTGTPKLLPVPERLFLLTSVIPILPLLPPWSGLARGSGVRRGLLASGVEPRRGLSEPLSTLPLRDPPLKLPRLSVGDSIIS